MKHFNRFELNAILIALWFSIGQLFTYFLTFISPKWGMAWYYIANGGIEYMPSKVYPNWQLLNIGWLIYLYGFIILLILINIKYSFNNCINNNDQEI